MRAKILGLAVVSSLFSASLMAVPVTTTSNMTASFTGTTQLNVDNFNNVSNTTITAIQASPGSLKNTTITDSTSLQNLKIYTNDSGGVTVTATNQGPGNTAVLANASGGPSIPYSINYTPCGSSTPVALTACTGASGCTITYAEANDSTCQTSPGTGTYTFGPTTSLLGSGQYSGGTSLAFSAGL